MNAIQALTRDHNEIKSLFKEFGEVGEKAHKRKSTIAAKIMKELMAHEKVEEQLFYPAALEKVGKETKEVIHSGIEEHRIADFLMERIQNTSPEDENFTARVKVLVESVIHHIKEEERQLFPEARKALGEEIDALGERIEKLHNELEGEAK